MLVMRQTQVEIQADQAIEMLLVTHLADADLIHPVVLLAPHSLKEDQ